LYILPSAKSTKTNEKKIRKDDIEKLADNLIDKWEKA